MHVKQKERIIIRDLGLLAYEDAYAFQKDRVAEVIRGREECLVLCEHPPTITLGRLARLENIYCPDETLAQHNIKKVTVDRGGDVTFHGPGQLVAYPILDLKRHERDLHLYLREIEQVAIDFLGDFGILTFRISDYTGVWYGKKKIASIGIGVRQWVTYHGIAINLNIDLKFFSLLKPCGLDIQMTSAQEIIKKDINFPEAKMNFVKKFCNIFHMQPLGEGL